VDEVRLFLKDYDVEKENAVGDQIERRKHLRFETLSGANAVLKDDGDRTKFGRIFNISEGGLGLACIQFEKEIDPHRVSRLDIVQGNAESFLADLPCRILQMHNTKANFPLNSLTFDRYCIQFHQLTASQRQQLQHFINRYARKDRARLATVES
jgi:c-di-GMP-binding flagellar brake protein YcgR